MSPPSALDACSTCSGGQRQRIAIARAIVRNAPNLILDEPIAGLDAASVQAVLEALQRLMEGRTCIVIARHLSTVRRADIILVVPNAELVARSTHETLLANGDLYAEMYGIQTSH
jgi:ABC-type multidrug transport system fused ATPase/permease subunit